MRENPHTASSELVRNPGDSNFLLSIEEVEMGYTDSPWAPTSTDLPLKGDDRTEDLNFGTICM